MSLATASRQDGIRNSQFGEVRDGIGFEDLREQRLDGRPSAAGIAVGGYAERRILATDDTA